MSQYQPRIGHGSTRIHTDQHELLPAQRFPDIDPQTLQDPIDVARTVRFVLSLPEDTVIPEVMVLPMRESSWP